MLESLCRAKLLSELIGCIGSPRQKKKILEEPQTFQVSEVFVNFLDEILAQIKFEFIKCCQYFLQKSVMSSKDMLIQYNYSEGPDDNSKFSRTDKDSLQFPVESNSEFEEPSLVEDFSLTTQRSSLKRKNDATGKSVYFVSTVQQQKLENVGVRG